MKRIEKLLIFGPPLLGFSMSVAATVAFSPRVINSGYVTASAAPLSPGVWLATQIGPDDIAAIRRDGFTNIVDIQPDSEEPTRLASDAVGSSTSSAGMTFSYLPIPVDGIPDDSVERLAKTIATSGKTLVYCRSGKRAVRTWALAEASRAGGMMPQAILAVVTRTGFTASDLVPAIQKRFEGRTTSNAG